MTDTADLERRLRALSRAEHSDLSIGDEAADALAAQRARIAELEGELSNIAQARRFDREAFRDDTEFADWAQSRARHRAAALAPAAGAKRER